MTVKAQPFNPPSRTAPYEGRPTYYDCGCCGSLHPANWDGDCRDDDNRFDSDELDRRHGWDGWDEIDMDEVDEVDEWRETNGVKP